MKKEEPSIIAASNRGALVFDVNDGQVQATRGAGGLVTALSTAMQGYDNIWISAGISQGDKYVIEHDLYDQIDGIESNFRFVDIGSKEYDDYYNVISNKLLWFCYHYLWKLSYDPVIGSKEIDAWQSYKKVNWLFARQIIAEIADRKNPLVSLHDYHLLLAAKYIRNETDKAVISHFSHTAWPQSDYMSILPKEIVGDIFDGMLANDLLGFQSQKYRHNFLLCVSQLTGRSVDFETGLIYADGRIIKTAVYPISVDSEKIIKQARSSKVREYGTDIRKKFEGLKILVRIERADPTKNTLRGLEAYRRFLIKYPKYKEKVAYACLMYSSRTDIAEYNEYFDRVKTLVGEINTEFGNKNWEPIYLDVQDNYERSLAALSLYDVLVVNSVYDGMNLIAKEGPLVNQNNGVLLLSENTGAFDEIGEHSLGINPFSIEDTADKMDQALSMDQQSRKMMYEELVKAVKSNTAKIWLERQLKDAFDQEADAAKQELKLALQSDL